MASNSELLIGGLSGLGNAVTGLATKSLDDPRNQKLSSYQQHIAKMLRGELDPREAATLIKLDQFGGSAPPIVEPQALGNNIGNSYPNGLPGLGGGPMQQAPGSTQQNQGLSSPLQQASENRINQQAGPPLQTPDTVSGSETPTPETVADFNTLLEGLAAKRRGQSLEAQQARTVADTGYKDRKLALDERKLTQSKEYNDARIQLGADKLGAQGKQHADKMALGWSKVRQELDMFNEKQSSGQAGMKEKLQLLKTLISEENNLNTNIANIARNFADTTPGSQEFINNAKEMLDVIGVKRQELMDQIAGGDAKPATQESKSFTKKTVKKGKASAQTEEVLGPDMVWMIAPNGTKVKVHKSNVDAAQKRGLKLE